MKLIFSVALCITLVAAVDLRKTHKRTATSSGGGVAAGADGKPGVSLASDTETHDVTTVAGAGDSEPPPQIGYIGLGYDIVKGNPQGDKQGELDPGFRDPILKLKIVNNCPDWEYLCPEQGYAMKKTSCNFASSATDISSMSDYSNSLSVEASVEGGGGWGPVSASFSASAGYNSASQTLKNSETQFFDTKALCTVMVAGMKSTVKLDKYLDPTFKKAVEGLPSEFKNGTDSASTQNQALWTRFIKAYGTHFTRECEYGAKRIIRSEVSTSSVTEMKQKGYDVGASISASYGVGSGAVSSKVSGSSESTNAAKNAISKTTELNIGGTPEDAWQDWAKTVDARPMPVSYKLVGIDTLIADAAKKAAFRAAADAYAMSVGKVETSSGPSSGFNLNKYTAYYVGRSDATAVSSRAAVAQKTAVGDYHITLDSDPSGEDSWVPFATQVYPDTGSMGKGGSTYDNAIVYNFKKDAKKHYYISTGDGSGDKTDRYFSACFVDPSLEDDLLISGVVHEDGSPLSGNKFTVAREQNVYTVTFAKPFAEGTRPSVVANKVALGSVTTTRDNCIVKTVDNTQFTVVCGDNDGNVQASAFSFAAVSKDVVGLGDMVKLGITHGHISSGGNIKSDSGSGGYVVSKSGTGLYKVRFDSEYKDEPVVVVTQHFSNTGDTRDNCILTGIRKDAFSVFCGDGDGSASDRDWAFVALGLV